MNIANIKKFLKKVAFPAGLFTGFIFCLIKTKKEMLKNDCKKNSYMPYAKPDSDSANKCKKLKKITEQFRTDAEKIYSNALDRCRSKSADG